MIKFLTKFYQKRGGKAPYEYVRKPLHSASVKVVCSATTPAGRSLCSQTPYDGFVLVVLSAVPKKGTVSAKADTPLFRLPIVTTKNRFTGSWQHLGFMWGRLPPHPCASFGNCIWGFGKIIIFLKPRILRFMVFCCISVIYTNNCFKIVFWAF